MCFAEPGAPEHDLRGWHDSVPLHDPGSRLLAVTGDYSRRTPARLSGQSWRLCGLRLRRFDWHRCVRAARCVTVLLQVRHVYVFVNALLGRVRAVLLHNFAGLGWTTEEEHQDTRERKTCLKSISVKYYV